MQENSFRLPEFQTSKNINPIFGRMYCYIFRQLKTEDCSCTEYNQHTRSTAKLPTDATQSNHRVQHFRQTIKTQINKLARAIFPTS